MFAPASCGGLRRRRRKANDACCWSSPIYADGGLEHVAAYLAELNLSDFNPKAPPPKTAAFWDIVNASLAPEDAELADVLDKLEKPNPDNPEELVGPDTATIADLIAVAAGAGDISEWLMARKNRRSIPHRLERCGYVPVRNPNAKDGLWKINGARQAVR